MTKVVMIIEPRTYRRNSVDQRIPGGEETGTDPGWERGSYCVYVYQPITRMRYRMKRLRDNNRLVFEEERRWYAKRCAWFSYGAL